MNTFTSKVAAPLLALLTPTTIAMLGTTDSAIAQFGFNGLKQECQLLGSPPTISFNTPNPSIANSFNWIVQVADSQIAVLQRNGQMMWRNNISGVPVTFGCGNPGSSFFGTPPLGGTRVVNNKVIYDAALQRFAVVGMQQDSALVTGPGGIYIAWSNTSNPMPSSCSGGGGWKAWRTPVPNPLPGVVYQPDFNGLGQTSTHVVYSGVLQPLSPTTAPSYVFYRSFRKSNLTSMAQGVPMLYDDVLVQRPTAEFAHAADSFDANSPTYLAAATTNSLRLTALNPGNNTEINFLLAVPFFIRANGQAPQANGSFLDTIDGRIQGAVVRNGQLYCCHTVMSDPNIGARHVVRWYQIALNTFPAFGGTPQLVQSGTIDLQNGVHAFMPTISVNSVGTMLVAFARSALTEAPGVGYAARRSIDAPGTTPQGGIMRSGLSSYTALLTTNTHRWGNWTSAVIDTMDPSRFLVSGSYAQIGGTTCSPSQPNTWRTWINTAAPANGNQVILYGAGFAANAPAIPTIGLASAPRLGTSPAVVVSDPWGIPTGAIGLIGVTPVQQPTGFGGDFLVDPATATSLFFQTNGVSGSFNLIIPLNTAFIGFSLFLQAGVIEPNGTNIALTRGLQAIIGT